MHNVSVRLTELKERRKNKMLNYFWFETAVRLNSALNGAEGVRLYRSDQLCQYGQQIH